MSIEYSDEMVDGNMNAWQDLYSQMTGQFTVNYYKPTFTVGSISDAENVIGDSSLQSNAITAGSSTINYINTGSDGHYASSVAFPGTTLTTNSDNFVIEVMGTINVSASAFGPSAYRPVNRSVSN